VLCFPPEKKYSFYKTVFFHFLYALLRIRDVYPGSERDFSIPDPNVTKEPDPGSGSATLNLRRIYLFLPKNCSRKHDPGCLYRIPLYPIFIPDPDPFFFIPDPGSGSASLCAWMEIRDMLQYYLYLSTEYGLDRQKTPGKRAPKIRDCCEASASVTYREASS
jgi:hypothetical protein